MKVVCSRLPPQIGQVLAVQLIVQSGHRGPAFLDDRVESFLAQYRTELAGYSEDVLGGFVEAVCKKLTEKPKNIDQVCARRPHNAIHGYGSCLSVSNPCICILAK